MQVIMLMALLVGGCALPGPSPYASAPVAPTAAASTQSAAPTPSPTIEPSAEPSSAPTSAAAEVVSVKELPKATLDPAVTTAICDGARPDVQQADPPLSCAKELGYVASYLASKGQVPVRIWLERKTCARKECTRAELATGTAWAASATTAYEIAVDSRSWLISAIETADPQWPASAPYATSAIPAPAFGGAPAEISGRSPVPYCGRSVMEAGSDVDACFRGSVLNGKPAEVVVTTAQDGRTWLYRFTGTGAVMRYWQDSDTWYRGAGSMILLDELWDFAPWDGAQGRVQ